MTRYEMIEALDALGWLHTNKAEDPTDTAFLTRGVALAVAMVVVQATSEADLFHIQRVLTEQLAQRGGLWVEERPH